MLATTLNIVRSAMDADPTVAPYERAQILADLKNCRKHSKAYSSARGEPRLIRRAEVARRLSCSLRRVDQLAADGVLKKRKLPGRVRASGFLESDVATLITS